VIALSQIRQEDEDGRKASAGLARLADGHRKAVPDGTYHASDTHIGSIICGRILAVVMNTVQQLHQFGSVSLARWAALATAAGTLLLSFRDPTFREGD
jgi:hypothetical protein